MKKMNPLQIARQYFDLSNQSDFEGIKKLFTDSTTYSSANTGIYLGQADIMEMQQKFHGEFESLHWEINSINEVKPDIVLIDYSFAGKKLSGEKVENSGLEHVVIYQGTIQHIEIRNHTSHESVSILTP